MMWGRMDGVKYGTAQGDDQLEAGKHLRAQQDNNPKQALGATVEWF